jgi:hypothetical protein
VAACPRGSAAASSRRGAARESVRGVPVARRPRSVPQGAPGAVRARGRGDAAEVLAEVRRRLAVGPVHDELVAEAVDDTRAGRRPR